MLETSGRGNYPTAFLISVAYVANTQGVYGN